MPKFSEAKDFQFLAATRLIVGAGSIAQLGRIAREHNATCALVVSDLGVVRAGHAEKAIRQRDWGYRNPPVWTDSAA